jgi:hypothetical protein
MIEAASAVCSADLQNKISFSPAVNVFDNYSSDSRVQSAQRTDEASENQGTNCQPRRHDRHLSNPKNAFGFQIQIPNLFEGVVGNFGIFGGWHFQRREVESASRQYVFGDGVVEGGR